LSYPAFTVTLGLLTLFLFALGFAGLCSLLRGALRFRRRSRDPQEEDRAILLKSPLAPRISIIAAVSDAAPSTRDFVRRLLDIQYGNQEVIVVLDGPNESEMAAWKQEFRLSVSTRPAEAALQSAPIRCVYESADPIHLVAVYKQRSGWADSLNAAVNIACSPLIGVVTPDSDFHANAFLPLVRSLLQDSTRAIVACGADVAASQKGFPAKVSALESVRFWLARCSSTLEDNLRTPPPGSSLLLRRDAILQAGGFRASALELFAHVQRNARASHKPYRITFVPGPVSHARPARTLAQLRKATIAAQREIAGAFRWLGLGAPGLPGLFASRVLRPALETAAYLTAAIGVALGCVDVTWLGLVLLASVGIGILQSCSAVIFREFAVDAARTPAELRHLFCTAIVENFGYRQLRNLWLIAGLFPAVPAFRLTLRWRRRL
jgi:cellulose synthase/poly-beta-1,6-N-acetylglucosamine synthase-like glycosyltransferase